MVGVSPNDDAVKTKMIILFLLFTSLKCALAFNMTWYEKLHFNGGQGINKASYLQYVGGFTVRYFDRNSMSASVTFSIPVDLNFEYFPASLSMHGFRINYMNNHELQYLWNHLSSNRTKSVLYAFSICNEMSVLDIMKERLVHLANEVWIDEREDEEVNVNEVNLFTQTILKVVILFEVLLPLICRIQILNTSSSFHDEPSMRLIQSVRSLKQVLENDSHNHHQQQQHQRHNNANECVYDGYINDDINLLRHFKEFTASATDVLLYPHEVNNNTDTMNQPSDDANSPLTLVASQLIHMIKLDAEREMFTALSHDISENGLLQRFIISYVRDTIASLLQREKMSGYPSCFSWHTAATTAKTAALAAAAMILTSTNSTVTNNTNVSDDSTENSYLDIDTDLYGDDENFEEENEGGDIDVDDENVAVGDVVSSPIDYRFHCTSPKVSATVIISHRFDNISTFTPANYSNSSSIHNNSSTAASETTLTHASNQLIERLLVIDMFVSSSFSSSSQQQPRHLNAHNPRSITALRYLYNVLSDVSDEEVLTMAQRGGGGSFSTFTLICSPHTFQSHRGNITADEDRHKPVSTAAIGSNYDNTTNASIMLSLTINTSMTSSIPTTCTINRDILPQYCVDMVSLSMPFADYTRQQLYGYLEGSHADKPASYKGWDNADGSSAIVEDDGDVYNDNNGNSKYETTYSSSSGGSTISLTLNTTTCRCALTLSGVSSSLQLPPCPRIILLGLGSGTLLGFLLKHHPCTVFDVVEKVEAVVNISRSSFRLDDIVCDTQHLDTFDKTNSDSHTANHSNSAAIALDRSLCRSRVIIGNAKDFLLHHYYKSDDDSSDSRDYDAMIVDIFDGLAATWSGMAGEGKSNSEELYLSSASHNCRNSNSSDTGSTSKEVEGHSNDNDDEDGDDKQSLFDYTKPFLAHRSGIALIYLHMDSTYEAYKARFIQQFGVTHVGEYTQTNRGYAILVGTCLNNTRCHDSTSGSSEDANNDSSNNESIFENSSSAVKSSSPSSFSPVPLPPLSPLGMSSYLSHLLSCNHTVTTTDNQRTELAYFIQSYHQRMQYPTSITYGNIYTYHCDE